MKVRPLLPLIGILLILGGCSVLGPRQEEIAATPTPLPTTNPEEGLRVVVPTACQAGSFPAIQVDDESGDMIAWSPDGEILAYVAPENQQWGWFSGDLTLLSMETGEVRATRDIKVTGDLTWSPDGSSIAFTALESTENIYTVIVLAPTDFSTINLYAAGAATDEFGSRKGIFRWTNSSRIQVVETCGVDCSRIVEFNLIGLEQRILSNGRKEDDHSLDIALNPGRTALNPDWLLANTSPDGRKIFYSDEDGNAWLVDATAGTKYQIDLDLGEALESKWSPDSQLLAVRTDENFFIYDLNCTLDLNDSPLED